MSLDHLSAAVEGLTPSATLAINERSNRLRAAGRRIFKLGLGQSPFPVPAPVVAALRAAAGEKDYLPVAGLAGLREAVAAHHGRVYGLEVDPEGVLIGPGSKELMFLLQLCYGGELLLPSPSWVSYAPQASLLGRRVRWIPTRREDGWRLTPEALDAACREDPGRPRLLILNYPSNPAGMSFTDDALGALAAVARRRGVLVLSDEIYGKLHHRGAHASIASHYPEGTIHSAGLSKWCGAGGWRLGVFALPPQRARLRAAMRAAASETFASVAAPIQYAAQVAFAEDPVIDRYLADSRRLLGALGRWIAGRLRAAGASLRDPEGGFYLLPDFSPLAGRLAARGITTSRAFAESLLAEGGVALLPGSDFGRPPEELTVRLAYVDFDGGAALAGLPTGPGRGEVDEAALRRLCPATVEGVERLCDWAAG